MQPLRPRISQKVLLELAEKLHQDDAIAHNLLKAHPLLARLQSWALLLIGGAWLAMLVTAPIFLFLLLFGQTFNFTGQWVTTAGWLLAVSCFIGGVFLITGWLDQFIRGEHASTPLLLAGVAILAGTIGSVFLIWQSTNDAIPPVVTVSIVVVLNIIFIGWGVYRVITERQTILFFRLLFLIATVCFAVGLLSNTIALKQEALTITPEHYRALQDLSHVLSPIGWIAFIISTLGVRGTAPIQRNKRASNLQLGLLGVLVIVVLLLLLFR